MKPILLLALAILPSALGAQDVTGAWNGVLDVQGTRLRLIFHVARTDSGYASTMDSPDQGAMGIPVSTTTFADGELRLELRNMGAVYTGTLIGDSIAGKWTQSVAVLPLVLRRDAKPLELRRRPQEPVAPYPYHEEEVVIENHHDSLTLAGTLTYPRTPGPHPAVVLISGSGPQNRDEEVFGHRPFLVLADHLTRQGIAVLRYDDRGIGASTGSFERATSRDFATDAASVVRYLTTRPEIDAGNIGLIGHSEGALIAPMVAAQSSDVAFIVLLAGIGIPGREVSLMQARTLRTFPVSDEEAYERFTRRLLEIASSPTDVATRRAELTKHYESMAPVLRTMLPENIEVDVFIAQQVAGLVQPWQHFFLTYDPATDLEKLQVPVLSLNGSNDVQVPAEINQRGIRKALERAGNTRAVIKELAGLNHMFQESETGAMSEYATLEQTMSPLALREITAWILEQVR